MSFVIAPPDSGYADGGISLPNYCSFVIADSGAGGQVFVNGLGVTSGSVADAVDLQTLFGTAFKSFSLLRVFHAVDSLSLDDVLVQFLTYLDINCYTWGGNPVTKMPSFIPTIGISGGPANAPYLVIQGPQVAGTWRIDLKLRHSITN